MKTYKTTNIVTVTLGNDITVVHKNASFYCNGHYTYVKDIITKNIIKHYVTADLQSITHTVEMRAFEKSIVYLVRLTNGNEYEFSDLQSAYTAAVGINADINLESIRRVEQEEPV